MKSFMIATLFAIFTVSMYPSIVSSSCSLQDHLNWLSSQPSLQALQLQAEGGSRYVYYLPKARSASHGDEMMYDVPIRLPSDSDDGSPRNSMKRGFDLGMGRGYSGNQQGKSQVGLIAANMASGPGKRKKRSIF